MQWLLFGEGEMLLNDHPHESKIIKMEIALTHTEIVALTRLLEAVKSNFK